MDQAGRVQRVEHRHRRQHLQQQQYVGLLLNATSDPRQRRLEALLAFASWVQRAWRHKDWVF